MFLNFSDSWAEGCWSISTKFQSVASPENHMSTQVWLWDCTQADISVVVHLDTTIIQ